MKIYCFLLNLYYQEGRNRGRIIDREQADSSGHWGVEGLSRKENEEESRTRRTVWWTRHGGIIGERKKKFKYWQIKSPPPDEQQQEERKPANCGKTLQCMCRAHQQTLNSGSPPAARCGWGCRSRDGCTCGVGKGAFRAVGAWILCLSLIWCPMCLWRQVHECVGGELWV